MSIQTAPCHPFGSLNVSGDHWRHACCGLEWIEQVKAVDKSSTFDLLSLAFYVIDVRRWNVSVGSAVPTSILQRDRCAYQILSLRS